MTSAVEGPAGNVDVVRLARGGALNLVGAVVFGASGFAIVVLLTAGLGAEGTGEVLVAIAVFNLVERFCELGASTGLVRTISVAIARGRPDEIRAALTVALVPVLGVGAAAGAVLWAVSGPLGELVADDRGAAVGSHLRLLGPLLPLVAAYSVLVSGSRGFGTMRIQAGVDRIGRSLIQVVAVGAVIVVDRDPGSAVIAAWVVPYVVAIVPAGHLVRRQLARVAARRDDGADAGAAGWDVDGRSLASRFWRFSLPRALSQVFQVGVLWFDVLLLGATRSTEEAGIYAASTRYLLVGMFTADALMQALGPNISGHLSVGRRAQAQRLYDAANTWQVAIVWPVYLLIGTFAVTWLSLFGGEFTTADTALVILAAGTMVAALLGPGDVAVLMAGRSVLSLVNSGTVLALNVLLNVVLIPRYGVEGAAVAWAASIVTSAALPAAQLGSATSLRPLPAAARHAAVLAVVVVGVPAVAARLVLGDRPVALIVAICAAVAAGFVAAPRARAALGLDDLLASFRAR